MKIICIGLGQGEIWKVRKFYKMDFVQGLGQVGEVRD